MLGGPPCIKFEKGALKKLNELLTKDKAILMDIWIELKKVTKNVQNFKGKIRRKLK